MGSTRKRNVPSAADTVSCEKFVSELLTTIFAPATTPCDRSLTVPKIDPFTSARATLTQTQRKTIEAKRSKNLQNAEALDMYTPVWANIRMGTRMSQERLTPMFHRMKTIFQ